MTNFQKRILTDIKVLSEDGTLENRRLLRYKNRIKDLISERLEKEFWTSSRVKLFKDITKSIDSIDAPPNAVLNKLISNFDK